MAEQVGRSRGAGLPPSWAREPEGCSAEKCQRSEEGDWVTEHWGAVWMALGNQLGVVCTMRVFLEGNHRPGCGRS